MSRVVVLAACVVLAPGCLNTQGESRGEPTCTPGASRRLESSCGLCRAGTAVERCTADQRWETLACENSVDRDGDGVPNETCDALPGGCCSASLDCNDDATDVHPAAYDCLYRSGVLGRPDRRDCTTTCGTAGVQICTPACAWPDCYVPDGCDGLDNDCDTETDEDSVCAAGLPTRCETTCDRDLGRGPTGEGTCSDDCMWPPPEECTPPAESCNGADDDCDTVADNGFPCAAGLPAPCETSCGGAPGAGTCGDDCVPAPPEACTAPGEVCNGIDDDCDTVADNGFGCIRGFTVSCTSVCGTTGTGACTDACAAPAGTACNPPMEECGNRIDDDCDTETDEPAAGQCVPGSTVNCDTPCGTTGTGTCSPTCVPPGPTTCVPPAETCNAADDDCDTVADNGLGCVQGSTGSCTASCGSTGSRACSATCVWGACTPPVEACNGRDDDCDGLTDEDFGCRQGSTGSCTMSCGTPGTRTCSATCAWGACAATETCNSVDDDCDGLTDEDFGCRQGSTGSCTTTCGTAGSRTCSATCAWGACAAAEICNNVDDDCDGSTDEGFGCPQGTSGSCTTTCGTPGTRTCSATCVWGACAATEICNNVDDDCDGSTDEDFGCRQGSSGSCSTTCATPGSRTCSATCVWGACTAAEVCNSVDDDCDGSTDEGFACPQGTSGSCTMSCGTPGTRTCTGTCEWGTCAAAEICNNVDDDCDGSTDEGFGCRQGTSESCTTTCATPGTRTCSATCVWGACTAAETCNDIDDDCDGSTDEGFACRRGTSGSCTMSCGTAGTRTCSPSCTWGTCGATEICNGIDDDCDTATDEGFGCVGGTVEACSPPPGGTHTCDMPSCTWGSCHS